LATSFPFFVAQQPVNKNTQTNKLLIHPPSRKLAMAISSSYPVPRGVLKDPDAPSTGAAIWKKVCFDDVHIREYGFILGDNPSVSKGAPLQIDWEYHNEDVIDVDIFEHCRAPVRRHRKKIVMSPRRRAKM
jgi:hypothetical protein